MFQSLKVSRNQVFNVSRCQGLEVLGFIIFKFQFKFSGCFSSSSQFCFQFKFSRLHGFEANRNQELRISRIPRKSETMINRNLKTLIP
jgi:hypothetical protein